MQKKSRKMKAVQEKPRLKLQVGKNENGCKIILLINVGCNYELETKIVSRQRKKTSKATVALVASNFNITINPLNFQNPLN